MCDLVTLIYFFPPMKKIETTQERTFEPMNFGVCDVVTYFIGSRTGDVIVTKKPTRSFVLRPKDLV